MGDKASGKIKRAWDLDAPSVDVKMLDGLDRARIARDSSLIEALLATRDVSNLKEAAEAASLAGGSHSATDALDAIGLGSRTPGQRIGGVQPEPGQGMATDTPEGFRDPLAGRRGRQPKTLVGPGGLPTQDSTVGQDTNYSSGSEGRPERGWVWPERHTDRQSADGTQTWGSTSYRDYSGNHWRVDYHDQRQTDGSFTAKDTVFNAQGEPIKTTVREIRPDGTGTETTTTHATGETQTREGDVEDIAPERSQTAEGTGAGDQVAPRGWYNPVTGASNNPGLKTGSDLVNPGPEQTGSATPVTPVIFNPDDLATDPLVHETRGHGTPQDIRRDDGKLVNPPRPF